MRPFGIVAALAVGGAVGCETEPDRTTTQWAAIETCEVSGRRDDVLRAASAVILDEGYFFIASDHEAGIVTGARVPGTLNDQYRRSGGLHASAMFDTLGLWVRDDGASKSLVRVQVCTLGRHVASRERVLAFRNSVQQRMLKPGPTPSEETGDAGVSRKAGGT